MKEKGRKKVCFKKDGKPVLEEIKIGCSVMDNEGASAFINLPKRK